MMIPAVMFIEAAMDTLKTRNDGILESEAKEFHCLGPARMRDVLRTVPVSETRDGDIAEYRVMLAGYLLGVETVRMMLAGMPAAVRAGVSI